MKLNDSFLFSRLKKNKIDFDTSIKLSGSRFVVLKENFALLERALINFMLENVALDKSLMQLDGIHPNRKAQPFIAEFVKKELVPGLNISSDYFWKTFEDIVERFSERNT